MRDRHAHRAAVGRQVAGAMPLRPSCTSAAFTAAIISVPPEP
jgi:hypothetical protein